VGKMISLDSETVGLDIYHGAKPFFVVMCEAGSDEPFYFEWEVDPLTREPHVPSEDIEEIRNLITSHDTLVLQNGKFDVAALRTLDPWFANWPWEKTEDTLIAGHLLSSNTPHDLTTMTETYVGKPIQKWEDDLEEAVVTARRACRSHYKDWAIAKEGREDMPSAKGQKKLWKVDSWLPRALWQVGYEKADPSWETVLREYAKVDAWATVHLWLEQIKEIRRRGLERIYRTSLKRSRLAHIMENRGITVSKSRLDFLQEKYRQESSIAGEMCERIAAEYNPPFDLKMPKAGSNKVLDAFTDCMLKNHNARCDDRRVDVQYTETGRPSTAKAAVDYYRSMLPPHSKEKRFFDCLSDKRRRDTATSYLDGYRRFWLPWEKVSTTPQGRIIREVDPLWFVLHPSLNPTGTDTLRWSSSQPNSQNVCVDGETEVLTERGWIRIDELDKSTKVAQYWKDDSSIDFVYPTQLHSSHFTGNMQHIRVGDTNRYVDMLLTPEHRCLVGDRNGRKIDVPAKTFRNWCLTFHAGHYVGGGDSLNEATVAWLCAVQADGSYCLTNGEEYGVRFIFKKERKIERLRWALEQIGAKWSEKIGHDIVSFYVGKNDPAVILAKKLMPDKCFGSWLLAYDRPTLDLFAAELLRWDGHQGSWKCYTSSQIENSNWAQIIYVLTGSRASMSSRFMESAWSKGTHHFVNITPGRDYTSYARHHHEEVPWDGLVYCLTVPSDYIIIRRKGLVSVTGNSKNEDLNLRLCFGPAPGREWWSLDAKNIELRIPAYESGQKDLIDLFERPDDPPFYGSTHLLNFSVVYPDIWEKELREVGIEKVGPHCKKKYASSWYQWCKNGGFAVQYGAVDRDDGGGTADRAFHRRGAHSLLRTRFSKLEALNRRWIRFAEERGYVETLPDRSVDPDHGYPLLCNRTEYGRIKPTVPLNYHVQGTAMWWTMMAMIRCQDYLDTLNKPIANHLRTHLGYHMTIQCHDELVFDFPAGKGSEPWKTNLPKIRHIQGIMERCGDGIGVPTPVGLEYHESSWAEGVTL
jgi:DNA polymerase I-like protein with 3'-5' exonuclease and polymerase domains